ncbi:hypothetical protein LF41_3145 [Lysobacter dokdonensis DS-58]|uniref:Uncharacterized protein n=1 Tax=Lysobacter dokdonensis DS-58 TaxID=1300345 RepID=A0A0A2WH70_9GAMM|nr:hypothetical protein LF41_3145 [Lysobacter dokdonensis DS-58]
MGADRLNPRKNKARREAGLGPCRGASAIHDRAPHPVRALS